MSNHAKRAQLKQIIIFTLELSKTQDLLTDVLNLRLLHSTDHFSELTDNTTKFMLRKAPTLAHAATGFSPMLSFEVDDIEQICERAQKEYHCKLDDGGIVSDQYIRLACLKTQCGLNISIQEVIQENPVEKEYDLFVKEHGASALDKENGLDEKT